MLRDLLLQVLAELRIAGRATERAVAAPNDRPEDLRPHGQFFAAYPSVLVVRCRKAPSRALQDASVRLELQRGGLRYAEATLRR